METHMFWAYGNFSKIEFLSAKSYIKFGYDLNIWSYDEITNLPSGCKLRDARSILSEDKIFLNKAGSFASFSDLFRYALLSKIGGLYSDTDVIALRPPKDITQERFLVTERILESKENLKINNNLIFNPKPTKGDVIDLAFSYSSSFQKENIIWGEIGPNLLTAIIGIFPNHNYLIFPAQFANPLNYWEVIELLFSNSNYPAESYFIHLYNEMWRRHGIDKNMVFPQETMIGKIEEIINS